MARDKREYGLTQKDREWVIRQKFGFFSRGKVKELLEKSNDQSDKVLGAILFLARPKNLEDLESGVNLANDNVQRLLDSATVKDERS